MAEMWRSRSFLNREDHPRRGVSGESDPHKTCSCVVLNFVFFFVGPGGGRRVAHTGWALQGSSPVDVRNLVLRSGLTV